MDSFLGARRTDRFHELNQKRETTGLTAAESREFEVLFNAKSDASRTPEMQQLRADRDRILEQGVRVHQTTEWNAIFRTPIQGFGKPLDTEENRNIIWAWWFQQARGEDVLSYKWFAEAIKNPKFANEISWTISLEQRKSQAEKDAQALRARFAGMCRTHGVSEIESNFQIWSSEDNPDITTLHDGYGIPKLCILKEDGTTPELIPAGNAEKNQWEQEHQERLQERHQQRQQTLIKLRDTDAISPAEVIKKLHKIRDHELVEKQERFETTRQQNFNRELAYQFERDQASGYTTPLPAHITPEQIRKLDANKMRQMMRRYGASRITARLHQITEVPNGHGGVYRFE